MKPSDFYLSSRQFFGYLIPGMLWLSALSLGTTGNPVTLMESGQESIHVLLRVAGFVGLGYVLGATMQRVCFLIATFWHTPRCCDEELRKTVSRNSTEDGHLPSLCKSYVVEYSEQLRDQVFEHEAGVNLRVGFPPAVFALATALVLSQDTVAFGRVLLVVSAVGWYASWFVPAKEGSIGDWKKYVFPEPANWAISRRRNNEIESWYKMFIVLTRLKGSGSSHRVQKAIDKVVARINAEPEKP